MRRSAADKTNEGPLKQYHCTKLVDE